MKRNHLQRDTSVIELLSEKASECDEFEGYKHPHASRLAALADELAKLFILGTEDRVSLKQAALAHDAGEMLMARPYIKRAGPLTDDEIVDLKRHPLIGEQEASRAGADRGAQLIVRWHHEWWNGSGYPDAIRREQIPLTARILRLSDSFVSLTDNRPYRKAFTVEQARKHLTDWAGLEFDPHVVKAFLSMDSHRSLISHASQEPVPLDLEEPSVSGSGL